MIQHFGPYMAPSDYFETAPSAGISCVINLDTMFHANRQVGPYAASKAALKVLTTALADTCRAESCAFATLQPGPLADDRKMRECERIAEKNGVTVETVFKALLKKANPF